MQNKGSNDPATPKSAATRKVTNPTAGWEEDGAASHPPATLVALPPSKKRHKTGLSDLGPEVLDLPRAAASLQAATAEWQRKSDKDEEEVSPEMKAFLQFTKINNQLIAQNTLLRRRKREGASMTNSTQKYLVFT